MAVKACLTSARGSDFDCPQSNAFLKKNSASKLETVAAGSGVWDSEEGAAVMYSESKSDAGMC